MLLSRIIYHVYLFLYPDFTKQTFLDSILTQQQTNNLSFWILFAGIACCAGVYCWLLYSLIFRIAKGESVTRRTLLYAALISGGLGMFSCHLFIIALISHELNNITLEYAINYGLFTLIPSLVVGFVSAATLLIRVKQEIRAQHQQTQAGLGWKIMASIVRKLKEKL